jgi:hypothetical protein
LVEAVSGLVDRELIQETTPSHSVMRGISAESRSIAPQGADQATMSLDSLYSVCKQNGAANSDLQSAVGGLFVQVLNPSAC